MKTDNQPQHTQGEWKEIDFYTDDELVVLAGETIICKLPNTTEGKANAQRIVKAVNMHDDIISETDNIKFYASQALKSLDNGSLSEVRGLLEGILEKSTQILKKSEGK